MQYKELFEMTAAMCKTVTEQIGNATSAEELEALAKVASVAFDIAKFLGVSQ